MLNKVAVVTGAARGIGHAVATRLAADGFTLAVVDKDWDNDDALAGMLDSPGSGVALRYDLGESDAPERVVTEVSERFGRIDVLVNNAGLTWPAPIEETNAEDWDRIMAVNLRAPFLLTRAVVPMMEASGGGSIVNVSSFHANATLERFAAYAASKTGLVGMTRSTALELAPRGIRVNAVGPGITETAMWHAWLETVPDADASLAEALERQPMNRIGKPEEIAAAVAFLVSEDASYMTGSLMTVDGGVTARLHHA